MAQVSAAVIKRETIDQPITVEQGTEDDAPFGNPIFKTIDDALGNWARWSRERRGQGHCASIEHRFRTPNHFHPPSPNPSIDVFSALIVEREMRQLPREHRLAVIYHYVWLAPSRYICRMLRLSHSDWPWFLADGVSMIANRVRKAVKAGRLRVVPKQH